MNNSAKLTPGRGNASNTKPLQKSLQPPGPTAGIQGQVMPSRDSTFVQAVSRDIQILIDHLQGVNNRQKNMIQRVFGNYPLHDGNEASTASVESMESEINSRLKEAFSIINELELNQNLLEDLA